MRYFPHTDDDVAKMLETVNVASIQDLFSTIPETCRMDSELTVQPPFSEWKLNDYMRELSSENAVPPEYKIFAGAGSYHHHIPATVAYLSARSEFTTSYTPYQPELSQGTLQAIFEYQTLTARLLGMDMANASMYDGASALAEALLMAVRITGLKKVAVSMTVHPEYRRVAETYFKPSGYEIVWIPYDERGKTDPSELERLVGTDQLAAIAVQSPNFFGCIEDLQYISGELKGRDPLFITSFTEPLAFGLYKNPGGCGADIVCGEGQSLGISQSFGGPGLGMFATRHDFMRNIPGRVVGQTTDTEGNRGYVLTLATREQHIRREKATSNICTNQGLCALTAAMYMASLGGTGFRELATLNFDRSEYLKACLKHAGFTLPFDSPGFNECVVSFSRGFDGKWERLAKEKLIAGLPLEPYYPELANHALLCVTEVNTKDDIDLLVEKLRFYCV